MLGYLSEFFWVTSKLAMPILATALVVGLLISIFQVVTQIQEMTLTFVPKLIVVLIVVGMLSGWLLETIQTYAITTISKIAEF
ncbi:export protein FliQ, family 3 [Shewanella denitrificans OS217]|jgi:flagellar biosynthetic protein FliQ|uniref:Export protein FliQ, family 3 n=2 Tax=Shewanella TaxID=22 RepID=Q12T88_SHEDO|nr:flagellar biosynthetic protein FliQ [Shewanella denitrificans]ABE53338.1 export protein FliQ, family 3 [Shewanella denitrificans OS217]